MRTLQCAEVSAATTFRAGEAYGEYRSDLIRGFLSQEVGDAKPRVRYAERCLPSVEKYAPHFSRFLRGMARSTGLSRELLTLLTLHEEIFHQAVAAQTHCTAVIGPGRHRHTVLVAQNWDWPPKYLPWPGLLRLSAKDSPRVVSYELPGLPTCAGINEHGLCILWTGAGYFPVIPPRNGVPTYALIFEILKMKTIEEAVRYLARAPRAGSFIFFLGDAKGDGGIFEATPTTHVFEPATRLLFRANHFACPALVKASRQCETPLSKNSTRRIEAMNELIDGRDDTLDVARAKKLLLAPDVYVRLGLRGVTIDSFIADPKGRALIVRPGGAGKGARRWKTYL